MYVTDVETTRRIDQRAMTEYSIPGILLMDNAALAVKRHLDLEKDYFVIVCGTGNNGGDGLALSLKLKNLGKEVDVFLASENKKPEGDAGVFYEIVMKSGISLEIISDEDQLWSFIEALKDADVVVDALLGTGIKGDVSPLYAAVIDSMNDFAPKIISVDIPSGLSADTGMPMPVAVIAHRTVTFETIKKGLISYSALPYVGKLAVEPIGIPETLLQEEIKPVYFTDHHEAEKLIPERELTGHKNHYGRVLVVAGSRGFTGAAMLSSEAALATGSGLVTLCSYDETMQILVPRLTEIMSLDEENLEEGVGKADIVAFGPGLGNSEETFQLLLRVIKTLQEEGKSDSTLVIDADGLNALEGRTEILKPLCFNVVLTPHPGEMARLTGKSVKEIEDDRMGTAKRFAQEHDVIVVLKGYRTVVTDGRTVNINSTGSSAMAQGGMGDVLTGIIASLSGQGLSSYEAAILGTFIHGCIGDQLALERYSVKASEIIENIPFYMKKLLEKSKG
ncbi:NAD(P)H-hydrate dehydratase [Proteiniclasticum sp.]|uniref:NAD(P)H-hydrate dehydratase n=1 Tax=Proteiniclasticum sp. TaxID=2053595 RepID=UPI00289F284E|nr:NAD(P)H-hydrate dehydratase [Proteiniclasticum sp.]